MKQLSSVSINQVPTYRWSTHVSIKYSCLSIKYSNVYRSIVTYMSIMNSQLYWRRNSHLYWSIIHIYLHQVLMSVHYVVLTWISIKHSYLSILCINQVFTRIHIFINEATLIYVDQVFLCQSSTRYYSLLMNYSRVYPPSTYYQFNYNTCTY